MFTCVPIETQSCDLLHKDRYTKMVAESMQHMTSEEIATMIDKDNELFDESKPSFISPGGPGVEIDVEAELAAPAEAIEAEQPAAELAAPAKRARSGPVVAAVEGPDDPTNADVAEDLGPKEDKPSEAKSKKGFEILSKLLN